MFWDEISNGGAATSPVQGLCSILRRPMSAIVHDHCRGIREHAPPENLEFRAFEIAENASNFVSH